MRHEGKKVMRVVYALKDARPTFVSLVGHGANQTPFKSVKAMANIAVKETEDMAGNEMIAKEPDSMVEVTMQKMTFDKAAFADKDAVIEYLSGKGFVDFSVTDDGDKFSVEAEPEEKFSVVRSVVYDRGVMAYVGELHTGDEPEQKTTAKELTAKFDACMMYFSNGKTIADVMQEGADGIPVGFWDVTDAFIAAFRNNARQGDVKGITALAKEYGQLLTSLVDFFRDSTVDESVVKAMFNEPDKGKAMTEEVKKDAATEAQEETVEATDTQEQASDAPAAKDEQATQDKDSEAENTAQDAAADETTTKDDEVLSAIEKLSKVAETLSETQKSMQETAETSSKDIVAQLSELTEKLDEQSKRVEALEQAGQKRKSADEDGSSGSGITEQRPAKVLDKATKNLLGFRE